MGNSDELHVRELHARSFIAIIHEGVDAGGAQIGVQLVGRRADDLALVAVERNDDQAPGRDRIWPDDARIIMALFDGCADDARDAEAVGAHRERACFAGFVLNRCLHGG